MSEELKPLLELIEAYAAARATGNSLLVQSAGASLAGYLETVQITPVATAQPEPQSEHIHE